MAAVPRADQDRPAPPVATADLEAAIAALPVRKERLRESFDRLVACAPPQYHLPFTWDDIDAHVSSLHASLSLRFRQMQQQQQPHPAAPVSATAAHVDEQPNTTVPVPVPATATPDDEHPDPSVPVSAAHDGESIQEDEEMVTKDQSASPIPEDEEMVSKDEGASPIQDEEEIVSKDEGASPIQEDEEMVSKEEAGTGAPCRQARGTRDQEFRAPMRARAGRPMLRQRYTASPPGVHSQLNLPMLQRQQPFMPYQQQEFPAMAVAMNNYNIPPMVQHPYYNIPPMVQQPYLPYCREEFSPDFRQRFSPDFSQEFFPDVTRQPPMGIDHVLQERYMAMARRQPYSPQQQYMAHHQPHFPVAQAAGSRGQGSNANKRRPPSRTTDRDNIRVRISEPSKKSRTIREHDAKPKPNEEPFQKKTVYDYF